MTKQRCAPTPTDVLVSHPQLAESRRPTNDAMVESRIGAVAWGLWPTLRFPSPLIKPNVPISGIRLSDWLQHKAHDGRPREAGVVRRHLEHNQSSPCGMSFL